ncbi:MAG TPA: hypothetical protein VGH27_07810 [Streptosporangiaceae bacterium]
MLIHGGSCSGGSSKGTALVLMSEELATLDYVVYNIDYCSGRPRDDTSGGHGWLVRRIRLP